MGSATAAAAAAVLASSPSAAGMLRCRCAAAAAARRRPPSSSLTRKLPSSSAFLSSRAASSTSSGQVLGGGGGGWLRRRPAVAAGRCWIFHREDLPRRLNRPMCSSSSSSSSSTSPPSRQVEPPSCHRVAIVGSGPAGCYTAKYLRSAFEKKAAGENEGGGGDTSGREGEEETGGGTGGVRRGGLVIDVFDRLATIGGLVRYGVAPDHPEVKNALNDFESLFLEGKGGGDGGGTAAQVSFYGNVQVGRDVGVEELRRRYDAVVLACGCESDRKLNVPGESTLEGVLSAREFVAWYNGHPDYVHIGEKVAAAICGGDAAADGGGPRRASVVVIGQANVALDCARVLAKGGTGLRDTDIASHALPVIGDGGVDDVTIVGRRGHVQGAFTIKELRELVKLEGQGHGASFHVLPEELELGLTDASKEELSGAAGRPKKRIDKLLREASLNSHETELPKKVHLRFLLSPVEFEPDETDPAKLGSVVCERTKLEGGPGQQKAVGTGELHRFPAQLALVSIGYKGVLLPGLEQWFDEGRGVLLNRNGRVDPPTADLGGLYAAGWIKRGPSGIIGTNIPDAKDTVATIVSDLDGYDRAREGSIGELLDLRNVTVVDWDGYRRIDEREKTDKRSELQPREKITSVKLQLDIASSS